MIFQKMRPLVRSLIFGTILAFLTTYSWDIVANKSVIPFDMFQPFIIFIYEKVFPPKGKPVRYQGILHTFLNTPSLKHLAVPPNLGGPKNQTVYVVLGFSLLAAVLLSTFPNTVFQFIGFIISISGIFGYWMSLNAIKHYSYTGMPIVSYVAVAVSLLGIITIIEDPIILIKSLFKKETKVAKRNEKAAEKQATGRKERGNKQNEKKGKEKQQKQKDD